MASSSAALAPAPSASAPAPSASAPAPSTSAPASVVPESPSPSNPEMPCPTTPTQTPSSKRRSSSRSIKRKKFDDELVQYSVPTKEPEAVVKKPPRVRPSPQPNYDMPGSSTMPLPTVEKPKNVSKGSSKKSRKTKQPSYAATKDLGRWKPTDDLALVTAVVQSNDLHLVHLGIKFSCKFTLKEIQQRWYSILYEPAISKVALAAMKALHPDIVASIESKTLFSKEEQALLASVDPFPPPPITVFEELLNKNRLVFHRARTPQILLDQWFVMKKYYLLNSQTVPDDETEMPAMPFSQFEASINDSELAGPADEELDKELALIDRREKKEIKKLETELNTLQEMVSTVTGSPPPGLDNKTLAVLKGKVVRYLMRSREITIGRTAKDSVVDVDLSLEGPACKVSRQQGTILLMDNGDFFLLNEGKRPFFVDGRPILTGNKYKLKDNCVVEIAELRFTFQMNMDIISVIKREAALMAIATASL